MIHWHVWLPEEVMPEGEPKREIEEQPEKVLEPGLVRPEGGHQEELNVGPMKFPEHLSQEFGGRKGVRYHVLPLERESVGPPGQRVRAGTDEPRKLVVQPSGEQVH